MIDIPLYLKSLRKRFSLTQSALAAWTSDKRTNIAKYETNKAQMPLKKYLKVQEVERLLSNSNSIPQVSKRNKRRLPKETKNSFRKKQ